MMPEVVKNFTVYVLFSPLYETIYIGYTSNLIQRFLSHNKLGKEWTARYRPWTNIYCEYYEDQSAAKKREKELKSGKGRKWIWEKINNGGRSSGFISS